MKRHTQKRVEEEVGGSAAVSVAQAWSRYPPFLSTFKVKVDVATQLASIEATEETSAGCRELIVSPQHRET